MTPIDPERLLSDCDEPQLQAITAREAPLLVLASAGSGKTRVLTRRIGWRILTGGAELAHCLALTFTRKAANELRERLSSFGLPAPVSAGTFHAIALGQLRRRSLDLGRPVPGLLESKARLVGSMLVDARGRARRPPAPDQREFIALVAGEIEWAKARMITAPNYERAARGSGRLDDVQRGRVAELFTRYEQEKHRRRLVDFEDLLVELIEAIEQDRAFAASQRWRFRHLFVDEYQDVNTAQIALLQAWLGDRSDLFAVGDPQQAIYAWNGSDPKAIDDFPKRFPGAHVLRLDANYRSTPEVVAVAASVLAAVPIKPESPRDNGPVPSLGAYESDEAEAAGVAALLRSAHRRGRAWRHCAVLARTNAQLTVLEQALSSAGIPTRTGAGASLFLRPAGREALGQLEAHAGSAAFCAWLDDVELDTTTPPNDEEDDLVDGPSGPSEAAADLESLVALGRDYLLYDPTPTGDGFQAFARQSLRTEAPISHADGVELLTFHRAKGLEWPVVFVTGLEDGFVPIARAKSKESLEEEERLLYVALSRAADELHCSWAKSRAFPGRTMGREPSPYLDAIDSVRTGLTAAARTDADAARRAIADSRAALERARATK